MSSDLIATMQAHYQWENDVIERGLPVPDQLRDELMGALQHVTPDVVEWLEERLAHGNCVLDAHGGIEAPDELWDLWQAILLAWQHARWAEEAYIKFMAQPRRKPRGGNRKPNTDPVFRFPKRESKHTKGINQ